MDEKEILISHLENSVNITRELQTLEEQVDDIESRIDAKERFWKGMKTLAVIGNIIGFISVVSLFVDKLTVGMIIVTIICFVPAFFYGRHKSALKKMRKETEELQKKYSELQNDSALSWLMNKYRTSECIFKIAEYVKSGRADSLKEALNLLETEMHNERMESAAAIGAYFGAQSGTN